MEFYNHIHCKYTGIKGFLTVYTDALRYRYMITKKALEKARILAFWEKHGLKATIDHSGKAKRTLQLACIFAFVLKSRKSQVYKIIKLKKI